MRRSKQVITLVVMLMGLVLTGCAEVPEESATHNAAVSTETVEGTNLLRVTLSPKAAERLGIATTPVREENVGGNVRHVVPYSALLYDEHGATWVYMTDQQYSFVRAPITVESVQGDLVVLSAGPPNGTQVVTVGAAELYGAEAGVGGGH